MGIIGPRVTLFGNITVTNLPNLKRTDAPPGEFHETFFINVSPNLFPLINLEPAYRQFQAEGFLIQAFRDRKNRPVFHLRNYHFPEKLYHNDIINSAFWGDRAMFCSVPYLNTTLTFNLTMDFEALNMTFLINGDPCFHHPIDSDLFHARRAFFTFVASGSSSNPVAIYIDELSVYKRVSLLTNYTEHFHYSMHRMSHHAHHSDPHFLKNVSLANAFINGVSSEDPHGIRDTGARGAGHSADETDRSTDRPDHPVPAVSNPHRQKPKDRRTARGQPTESAQNY
jgi:hypothetical protein